MDKVKVKGEDEEDSPCALQSHSVQGGSKLQHPCLYLVTIREPFRHWFMLSGEGISEISLCLTFIWGNLKLIFHWLGIGTFWVPLEAYCPKQKQLLFF